MNLDEANAKVLKLLALASPGSGATANEAATAARIANDICLKYGISPSPPRRVVSNTDRVLPGQITPDWRPPPTQSDRDGGWGWWQWAGRAFGIDEAGVSGITDAQARIMALTILTSGAYIQAGDLEIIESALNGLLTEYGKILLDGIYALNV